MSYIAMFLNGALNAFIFGMGMMLLIFLIAVIVLLENSIVETIKENHKQIGHPHIVSIIAIIISALSLGLIVKLILWGLPLLWALIKLLIVIIVPIIMIIFIVDIVLNLISKK